MPGGVRGRGLAAPSYSILRHGNSVLRQPLVSRTISASTRPGSEKCREGRNPLFPLPLKKCWRFLGFDPVRSDVWDAPEMREPNKFTEYFGDNIFDVLIEVKDEIRGVNIGEMTPAASDAVKTQILVQALNDMKDLATVLKSVADELRRQQ